MASIARLQITNVCGGDCTAAMQFGANEKPLSILPDPVPGLD